MENWQISLKIEVFTYIQINSNLLRHFRQIIYDKIKLFGKQGWIYWWVIFGIRILLKTSGNKSTPN